MVDEIINYVQSVEFLSMELATVDPELSFSKKTVDPELGFDIEQIIYIQNNC